MSVRAKMQLQYIKENFWNKDSKVLTFTCQYDTSIPEDQRFQKATPSGQFEMTVDNPAALSQFKLGDFYYIDFTPVPAATKPA